MTIHDRIAASECVRLIGLLVEAKTPNAKDLAVLVASRLVAIAEHGAGEPAEDCSLEEWVRLARELVEDRTVH
jgi:hypothetical protein